MIIGAKEGKYHERFGLGTGPVDIEPYRSPSFYLLEKERVFKRAWLNVGHISDIPKSGHYVVRDVACADAKVIIVRGRDNVIRAFHDVCPHRGSKISPPGSDAGCVRSLRCRYHSWNFDLDGRLLYVPDEPMFFDLEKEGLHLLPIHCDIWEGFIFLNFQERPDVNLSTYVGEFTNHYSGLQHLRGFPLHPDTQIAKVRSVWDCNWKLAMGAFLEAYHIRTLHPKTIGDQFASAKNPFGHPEGVGRWGIHSLINLFGNSHYNADEAAAPVEAKFAPRGFHAVRDQAEMISAGLNHPAINATRTASWSQDIYLMFPNTFLYARSYGSTVVRWFPIAHNKVIWEQTLYFTKASNIRQRMAQEFNMGRSREIVMEDMINLADQQDAVSNSPLKKFNYSDNEVMLRMIDENIHRFIEADDIRQVTTDAP